MVIKVGNKFPKSSLYLYKEGGMFPVFTNDIFENKNIVLFGMPGAFTPTCSTYHIPSIKDEIKNFKMKSIDEVFCLVVNDIHVTKVWAEKNGAIDSGLKFITDPAGNLVKKLGMYFNDPEIGFINRSKRFCIVLEKLNVTKIYLEKERGVCDITSGKNILKHLD